MTADRRLYILGGGGHARVVADVAHLAGWTLAGIVDPAMPIGTSHLGSKVVAMSAIARASGRSPVAAFVAIGSNEVRVKVYLDLLKRGLDVPALVHPSAIVARDVSLEGGACVMAGAVIQPGALVRYAAIVNTNASVDHDCEIGEGSFVGPGATLCGNAVLGAGAFIGAGATIVPGIRIGPGGFVGAGTVAVEDIEPGGRIQHWRRGTRHTGKVVSKESENDG